MYEVIIMLIRWTLAILQVLIEGKTYIEVHCLRTYYTPDNWQFFDVYYHEKKFLKNKKHQPDWTKQL